MLMGRGERDHSDKEDQQKGNKKQRSTYKVHVPEEAIKAHHVQVQGATTPSLSGHVAHSSTVCEQMAKVRWVQPEAIKANNVTPIPLSARRDTIRSPRPREVVGELLDLAQFTGYDCGSRSQDLEKSIDPTPSSPLLTVDTTLQIPLCLHPRAAQVGRARNNAVVGPNRTGGVRC